MLITLISLTSAIAALGLAYLAYLVYRWTKEVDRHIGIMQHKMKKQEQKLNKSNIKTSQP
jgi:threonine/homoserine/homoserine lactone efflux protein